MNVTIIELDAEELDDYGQEVIAETATYPGLCPCFEICVCEPEF